MNSFGSSTNPLKQTKIKGLVDNDTQLIQPLNPVVAVLTSNETKQALENSIRNNILLNELALNNTDERPSLINDKEENDYLSTITKIGETITPRYKKSEIKIVNNLEAENKTSSSDNKDAQKSSENMKSLDTVGRDYKIDDSISDNQGNKNC